MTLAAHLRVHARNQVYWLTRDAAFYATASVYNHRQVEVALRKTELAEHYLQQLDQAPKTVGPL
jgi:hypothetical protein